MYYLEPVSFHPPMCLGTYQPVSLLGVIWFEFCSLFLPFVLEILDVSLLFVFCLMVLITLGYLTLLQIIQSLLVSEVPSWVFG